MLVKSGFSLRSGGASSSIYDKDSAGEFEDRSIGGTTSMLTVDDNNDSLFREPNATNLQPMASHTRASLGPTATLVSLGGGSRSRVSFGELRQPSVPPTTMLGARRGGESGFLIGEEEEEEGVGQGSEATPQEQRAEEVMLHESQSTLKGSFGYANKIIQICSYIHSFACIFVSANIKFLYFTIVLTWPLMKMIF